MKSNDTATKLPGPAKPPKTLSRLANLATRVISAGDAFEHDLQAPPTPTTAAPPAAVSRPATAPSPGAVKRTFRYPKSVDSELRRFVHRYNLEKPDGEAELTMDEVGAIMAMHFLASDPAPTVAKARGHQPAS